MRHLLVTLAVVTLACRLFASSPAQATQSPLPTPIVTPTPTSVEVTPTPTETAYRVHLPLMMAGNAPSQAERELDAITRYLQHVYEDGDVLNDWLTHVRPDVADALQILGQTITGHATRFTFTITFEGELADQAEFIRGFMWARREGMSNYQSMWIGMGEVLDNHLEEDIMDSVWLVIEEQCIN